MLRWYKEDFERARFSPEIRTHVDWSATTTAQLLKLVKKAPIGKRTNKQQLVSPNLKQQSNCFYFCVNFETQSAKKKIGESKTPPKSGLKFIVGVIRKNMEWNWKLLLAFYVSVTFFRITLNGLVLKKFNFREPHSNFRSSGPYNLVDT